MDIFHLIRNRHLSRRSVGFSSTAYPLAGIGIDSTFTAYPICSVGVLLEFTTAPSVSCLMSLNVLSRFDYP